MTRRPAAPAPTPARTGTRVEVRACLRACACVWMALWVPLWAGPAGAQEALEGTLKAVRDRGAIVLGYREDAMPFSYLAAGQPVGYAVDLCHEVAGELASHLGRPVETRFRRVTARTRVEAVASGEVDLECGSTTANAERAKLVAFSPITFVAGTKLLVPASSPVRSYRDLRSVVVTAGTTNEAAIQRLARRAGLDLRIVTAPSHAESFAVLQAGDVDAFATDDVLLYGEVAQHGAAAWRVTGEYLSYEPYGLMYRRDDPQFAAVVTRAFERMARDGLLTSLYARWFLKRVPSGETLGIPMSPQLEEVIRMLGGPE